MNYKPLLALLVLACLLVACDLVMTETRTVTVKLTWTAPGDDSMTGNATGYVGKYTTDPDSFVTHWPYLESWETPAIPAPSGERDSSIIQMLVEVGAPVFFAIKAFDENGFTSRVSNITDLLLSDTIPPADINDLNVVLLQ